MILNFEIFADSSANLTEKMIEEGNIRVISYVCTCNGQEVICYKNGKPFSQAAKEFYEKMAQGAAVSTSLISQERIEADKRNKSPGHTCRGGARQKVSSAQNLHC